MLFYFWCFSYFLFLIIELFHLFLIKTVKSLFTRILFFQCSRETQLQETHSIALLKLTIHHACSYYQSHNFIFILTVWLIFFVIDIVVDGGWSDWSPWSTCSVTCGTGTQSRYRACDSPSPTWGGQFCDGNTVEWRDCEPPCHRK